MCVSGYLIYCTRRTALDWRCTVCGMARPRWVWWLRPFPSQVLVYVCAGQEGDHEEFEGSGV